MKTKQIPPREPTLQTCSRAGFSLASQLYGSKLFLIPLIIHSIDENKPNSASGNGGPS